MGALLDGGKLYTACSVHFCSHGIFVNSPLITISLQFQIQITPNYKPGS